MADYNKALFAQRTKQRAERRALAGDRAWEDQMAKLEEEDELAKVRQNYKQMKDKVINDFQERRKTNRVSRIFEDELLAEVHNTQLTDLAYAMGSKSDEAILKWLKSQETPTRKSEKPAAPILPSSPEEPADTNSFRARRLQNQKDLQAKLSPVVEAAAAMTTPPKSARKRVTRTYSSNFDKPFTREQIEAFYKGFQSDGFIKEQKNEGKSISTPLSLFKVNSDI